MSIFGKIINNDKGDIEFCKRKAEEMNLTLDGLLKNSENREILANYGSDIPEKYHPTIERELGIKTVDQQF